MTRSVVLTGVAALLLTGCAQEMSRAERAVQEQIVEDRLEAWSLALNNRDLDTLAAYYHQDPSLTVAWPDGRRTRGWLEEQAAQEEFFGGILSLNVVPQDRVVEVLGARAAVATFRYSADIVLANTDRDIFSGQGTILWTKPEGTTEWVIHAEHLSRNP